MTTTTDDAAGLNLAVVQGRLSSDPTSRTLPSGDILWSYEVTVREPDRPAASVPVVLVGGNPPRSAAEGDEVVVVGRVRRRFFRAGGATASRTEVVADRVLLARRGASVRTALQRARGRLDPDLWTGAVPIA